MDEESPVLPNGNEALVTTIRQLQEEIERLKAQIKPDALAKALDSSYLSINNLRAFLQILATILTIFLAGAVYFGSVGLTNIFSIREEADKVKSIRESVNHVVQSTSDMEQTIKGHVTTIQADLDRDRSTFEGIEQDVKSRMSTLQTQFEDISKGVQQQSDKALGQLRAQLEAKLKENEAQIAKANAELREISAIFNKVGVQFDSDLSAREKQLLFLLAREVDPNNSAFNFNTASMALQFGRYDEALQSLEKVLRAGLLPPEILARAKAMQAESQKLKANPPEIRSSVARSIQIGDLDILRLHENTALVLWRNGYITHAQAQKIFDDSRIK